MVPTKKDDLRKMVTQTTIETYEELTPQLIQLIEKTKRDDTLSEAQKQDEISLHLLGYVKSCTNEIIVEVLAEILGLSEESQWYFLNIFSKYFRKGLHIERVGNTIELF